MSAQHGPARDHRMPVGGDQPRRREPGAEELDEIFGVGGIGVEQLDQLTTLPGIDEDAYHQNTLKALKWLLRDVERKDVIALLGSLKREWSEFDRQARETLAYAVLHGSIDEQEPTPAVADNVLAFAWIYGDVVHNDGERLAETTQHGVAERYRAAAPIVCRLIVQTVATLHFIEWLRPQDLITLPQEIFEPQVVVTDPVFHEKVAVFVAPAGKEMPHYHCAWVTNSDRNGAPSSHLHPWRTMTRIWSRKPMAYKG
ncbi:hypothetical protein [Rhodococcus jostii]|uniref:hypothetical protein n=1 Tax=Rhodococcus jostii TaxID=132919 RepID=UPI001ED92522|nr:hypothetical protein [Rhodococcus jostii]